MKRCLCCLVLLALVAVGCQSQRKEDVPTQIRLSPYPLLTLPKKRPVIALDEVALKKLTPEEQEKLVNGAYDATQYIEAIEQEIVEYNKDARDHNRRLLYKLEEIGISKDTIKALLDSDMVAQDPVPVATPPK